MSPRDSRTKRKVAGSGKAVPSTAIARAPSSTLPASSTSKDAPGGADSRATSLCCSRFQFTEGFLLDTVTGELWQFNKAAGVLVAVPRVDTASAGPSNNQLIMDRLQKAADAYAQMLAAIDILR